MSTIVTILDPSILTFLGVSSIPVMLLIKKGTMASIDRGFVFIVIGATILSAATFIDYLANVILGFQVRSIMSTGIWENRGLILAALFYFPGTVMAAIGMSSWLPALQRLDREILRRKKTETELTDLTQELERLAIKAEEANQAKSEFLASMSHELRTPLNAVIGFTDILGMEIHGPINTEQKDSLGHIEIAGRHLLEVVNDILDLSKIENGELKLIEEVINIDDTIADSFAILKPQFEGKKIQPHIDRKTDMTHLCADRRIVKQMLINLLSNAMKFSGQGAAISVRISDRQGALSLSVVDHGIGMRQDQVDYVLKPFSQVENAMTRSQEGTGLGLTIVKQMVELHGGNIHIQTSPGSGTTVTLTFPVNCICGDTSLSSPDFDQNNSSFRPSIPAVI